MALYWRKRLLAKGDLSKHHCLLFGPLPVRKMHSCAFVVVERRIEQAVFACL